jgi:hypothetical protein
MSHLFPLLITPVVIYFLVNSVNCEAPHIFLFSVTLLIPQLSPSILSSHNLWYVIPYRRQNTFRTYVLSRDGVTVDGAWIGNWIH